MTGSISGDKVLIVPNYTENEAKKLRSKDKKVRDSVKTPIAYYFQAMEVNYTPQRTKYEEFESAQGKIMIEKACDEYAKLSLSVAVYQTMQTQTTTAILDSSYPKAKTPTRSALSPPKNLVTDGIDLGDLTGTGRNADAWGTTHDFIELRRGFFDYLIGRPLTLVSALFPPIPVAYITDLSYSMGEGEEEAVWEIEFSSVTTSADTTSGVSSGTTSTPSTSKTAPITVSATITKGSNVVDMTITKTGSTANNIIVTNKG
jgi:hypothetical protein